MSPFFEETSWIKSSILEQLKTKSTIERFDEGRQALFPSALPIASLIKKTHYRFGEDPGAGHCHLWTQASLDPFIAKQLEQTESIICGESLLTQGEIKELFSALYDYGSSEGATRYGHPTGVEFLSGFTYELRKKLGVDDLNADDFHSVIYEELAQGRGVAIEIKPTWAYANHPIYHMGSTFKTVAPHEVFQYINQIPFTLYSTDDKKLQSIIQETLLFETLFKKYLRYEFVSAPYAHLFFDDLETLRKEQKQLEEEIKKTWAPYSNFFKNLFYDLDGMLHDLLKERQNHIQNYILPALQNGTVSLNPELVIQQVTSTISYADYNDDYASPKNHSKNTTYDYLLFTKNNIPVASAWLTLPDQRPDFIWLMNPSHITEPPFVGEHPYSIASKDLYQMTQKCISVNVSKPQPSF
ncbi:MAG: hypothetical protein HYW85_01995 [Deltaproteobacteria bacterium]|nr:hypothetical protein [Deltaproteobacteria bacterium]MBI3016923.1 hypothetical protein [Deltaproteobacteria bacterium]